MLATAIIVFREVLEAALIVGIVMAASRGIARRGLWIGTGVAAGVLGAGAFAALASVISQAVNGVGQELLNAAILLVAVVCLGAHVLWVSRHAKELSEHAAAVGADIRAGVRPLSALAGIAFVAVLREGAETVLFLAGIFSGSNESASSMVIGGALGLMGGAGAGVAIYAGLLRIPLRHFFTAVNAVVIFLAAGMMSQAMGFLVQADWLSPLADSVWNTSAILTQYSIPGTLLHTLVGYVAQPMGIQVVAYVATLVIFFALTKLAARTGSSASHSGARFAAIVAAGVFLVVLGVASTAHAGDLAALTLGLF
jgi:high-affinity iron transporter